MTDHDPDVAAILRCHRTEAIPGVGFWKEHRTETLAALDRLVARLQEAERLIGQERATAYSFRDEVRTQYLRAETAEAREAAFRAEVDRQLERHICYTGEGSRIRFWQDIDDALATSEDAPKEGA